MSELIKGPHQGQPLLAAGKPLAEAGGVLILIHGRGATAVSILELADHLPHPDLSYLAPQAAGDTWYPNRFIAPLAQNEPQLSSALQVVADLVEQVEQNGVPAEKIIVGGFSQGACLTAEFAARRGRPLGGLLVFSGGLIGPPGASRDYSGSLRGMPVFIGCSDVDFHVPLERVHETAVALQSLGADVTEKIYPGMGHTIIQDEIDQARKLIERVMDV